MNLRFAAELGVNWLGYHFNTEQNVGGSDQWIYYMLYGIERVGTTDRVQLAGETEQPDLIVDATGRLRMMKASDFVLFGSEYIR